jgi:hypothetical protein
MKRVLATVAKPRVLIDLKTNYLYSFELFQILQAVIKVAEADF